MNSQANTFQEMRELIDLSLEGSITPDQFARLESLILAGPDNKRYYCEYLNMSVGLERFYSRSSVPAMWEQGAVYTDSLLDELAREELTAPSIERVEVQQEQAIRERAEIIRLPFRQRVNKSVLAIAVTGIAALLMMVFYVQHVPSRTAIAVVTHVLNPVWHNVEDKIQTDEWLHNTDDARFLQSGIIQIEFFSGVKATIEGPAEFSVPTDDQIKLRFGKLHAFVSPAATGFTIRTPSAKVIDLGTEFGVKTELDGSTEVHVFRGKTMLMAGGEQPESRVETLSSGDAKAVNSAGTTVRDIVIEEGAFARILDSKSRFIWRCQSLSLTDIVGGGNGFGTGRMDYGIYLDSGELSTEPLVINGHGGHNNEAGNFFQRVSQIPAIDGVFVPDGGAGRVTVSSQGHVFSDCPDTSASWSTPVVNGARYEYFEKRGHLLFDEKPYGTPGNPCLFFHANAGITYDLEAIRGMLPEGVAPVRFMGLAAAPMNLYDYTEGHFDVWILVDGQVRFSQTMMSVSQSFPVDIPLTEKDRFLSIVVTDGVADEYDGIIPKNHCDWCLLGRPELVLEMK